MLHEEFVQALRNLGFEEKNDVLWGTRSMSGPALEMEYGDDNRPIGIKQIDGGNEERSLLSSSPAHRR